MTIGLTRSGIFLAVLAGVLALADLVLVVGNLRLQENVAAPKVQRTEQSPPSCPPSKFEGADYFGQFYEDYVLSYVFRDLAHGTYIDVGANDPQRDSATAIFYARGWRGITIEPNPDFTPLYAKLRPEGTHLNLGIGDHPGKLVFHMIRAQTGENNSGSSTFDDAEAAQMVARGAQVEDVSVEVMTLDSVLERHPLPDISFLVVDVEGFERQVLQSIDLHRHRPAVIMVEATFPHTEESSAHLWDGIVLRAGYLFAMFDGLNRYYVSQERADMLPSFVHIDSCVKMSKLGRKVKLDGWMPR